jgi:hypothetical protein
MRLRRQQSWLDFSSQPYGSNTLSAGDNAASTFRTYPSVWGTLLQKSELSLDNHFEKSSDTHAYVVYPNPQTVKIGQNRPLFYPDSCDNIQTTLKTTRQFTTKIYSVFIIHYNMLRLSWPNSDNTYLNIAERCARRTKYVATNKTY